MAIPIIHDWRKYFSDPHEGLGSSYERIVLNQMLLDYTQQYKIQSIIETPSFGFTGLSGINLLALAQKGCCISLEDHDAERIELIRQLWENLSLPLEIRFNSDYRQLDYPDNHFDMGYNFSAMWFTQDIKQFLYELCRVCSKLIIICVPNRKGIGYRMQIKDYHPDVYPKLKPHHIDPASIRHIMSDNGWIMLEDSFIDCPPWPDIGMNKELFLSKLIKRELPAKKARPKAAVSIMPYYEGKDSHFAERMLRYSLLERLAPVCFKQYWAHHRYLVFTKG